MTKKWFSYAFCALILSFTAPVSFGQGTIEGHVKLTGPAPRNPAIPMGADPNCLTINAGRRVLMNQVIRAEDGGLANAFVRLNGSFPASAVPATPVTIDQRACVYNPHVQGARVGQQLVVKNDDSTLHNIHSLTKTNNAFNTAQPQAGMVYKYQLKSEEVMLHVKCDVHPWMSGYIGVSNHPYYAVSDGTGRFQIAGVPAGKYTIQVWHEVYGPLTQTVEVKPGATSTVDFSYTGNEKAVASATLSIEEITVTEGTSIELAAPSSR
jgi:plastocyanin